MKMDIGIENSTPCVDIEMTSVAVHSPMTKISSSGSCYTSYAISLKSNNPCFDRPNSHTRRRYSDFLYLRKLLKVHYPTQTPPPLPSKCFLNRFSAALIEERKRGLEKFLKDVLAISVYLSDKSLHLFLQTTSSMSKIAVECFGDVPAPELMDFSITSNFSDTSSSKSSNHIGVKPTTEASIDVVDTAEEALVPIRRTHNLLIPRRPSSLDSSPTSSFSSTSTDTGLSGMQCSNTDCNRYPDCNCETDFHRPLNFSPNSRRVSFNENVTVVVVCNLQSNSYEEALKL